MQEVIFAEYFQQIINHSVYARRQQCPMRVLKQHFIAARMMTVIEYDFQRSCAQMRPGMVNAYLSNSEA